MFNPIKNKHSEVIIIHDTGIQIWILNELTNSYYIKENKSKTPKGIMRYLQENTQKFSLKNPLGDGESLLPSDVKVPLWTLGKAVKV